MSDMLRDLHCFADMIVCVALSINEAQVSVNPSIQVGISVKIAIAVGCAFHVPMIVCLITAAFNAGNSAEEAIPKISLGIFIVIQFTAWVLAVSVSSGGRACSIEMALVSVALHKLAVFSSRIPGDNTYVLWIKGFFFAVATAVQVILMNAGLVKPSNIDECVKKCPLDFCQIGTSVIADSIPTAANLNGNKANQDSWPSKTNLPTDQVSGWLIMDQQNVCAYDLLLPDTTLGLFQAWTTLMSFSGITIMYLMTRTWKQVFNENNGTTDQTLPAE